ncbi:cell wall-binding repeat-containing protein [Ornithinimicrobium cryptoxanthini]|uniref:Cell wall-binding repeat-containing protein n=1 Tax=Ornithinimicrobium cryptoxanthini TaxID=2934161 RepID=A0ABY4YKG4_9MICO|nr:cell wall-binding repeat-containing protein [Ornithinimicrobium cryptoxanthini]USQ76818.1 cell wall-binding repeat-containing protein [Ornithinimicrobium cryptoxanthini]
MRPTLAASLALALTATLLPAVASATTEPTSPPAAHDTEQVAEAIPDEHLDLEYGLVTTDPEDVALSEPTVVTDLTQLPAAEPNAESYPMPSSGYYTVTGGGWGHRIGMSQYGAHGAGLQGLDHAQILDFYYPGTNLETWASGMIRIGITIDNDGVTRVDHRPGLAVSHGTSGATYTLPEREQWRVRASTTSASSCVLEGYNGSTWSAYWPSGMATGCPVTFSSPTEGTVDLYLPSGSRRIYRGQLTATHHGSANLATVNRLPMQHYLRSVVSIEMSSFFHTQALRAQAVAARTYAQRGVNGTGYYDTCDTTYCQAYRGRGARQTAGGITSYEYPENTAAVDATDGQVLTYNFPSGKALATTMYAASTGGWTIPGGAGHPYLSAQADPYDNTAINTRHRWTAQLTATSLESRYGIYDVTRVQVLTRDGHGQWGGRILSAKVEGYTAGGAYTYANASGTGLYLARPWPTWNTGLSTDYFTFGDPGEAPPPTAPGEVTRLAGANRYATAAEVSEAWAAGVSVVYVVSGEDYADALAAAARSGIYDAPVLLTKKNSLPPETRSALTRLKPGRLVIVGGTGSVGAGVEATLRGYTTGGLERVQGADRYATAAALASYYGAGQSRVFLASGENFPDALTAAALAGKQHTPLLLTRSDRLDAATLQQLDRLNPGEIIVLGGTAGVSAPVAQQAASYATSGTFRRLAGANRYETAEQVALEYPSAISSTMVASGQEFPDALVGAALAGRRGVPVLLTMVNGVHPAAGDALEHLAPKDIFVLGGETIVSNATVEELADYLR